MRDIPSFIDEGNCLALDKESVNADIRSYVTAQLSKRRDFLNKNLSQDLLEKIRTKVGDRADGIWASCQLDDLARCRHQAAIEKALASLPKNLEETYRRMIQRIPVEFEKDAIQLLQFLVHLKRPLKLAEAKEVIATQVEYEPRGFDVKRRLFCETDITDYCPSLVTVVHTTDSELHLAHFSVKEYLLGENQFRVATASISITKTCLTYLTDIKDSCQEIKREFPLARYAAEVWADNAASAQASENIVPVIVSFMENEVTFQRWTRLYQADRYWVNDPGTPRGSRLYYACFVGLIAPVRYLIEKGADVNAQGGYYGNALQAASSRGHQEIVKLLLDKGADVNAQGGAYDNALYAASWGGHQEIVKLLLDKGADVNAQGGKYGNALQAASSGGHQEIVKLLLDKGADFNAHGSSQEGVSQESAGAGKRYRETPLCGSMISSHRGFHGR
ncbi:putative ankyrin repeat protein L63 [Podospora fimiseda]|uniref:Ankyrin repeat protein L63 n=1 Tax=Podospora fimiseda TaxID=252190 RepID=A0AAN7H5T6_9PEZI|nr:putative ankyrin repeat protein L63 [Podospora fimiseda]